MKLWPVMTVGLLAGMVVAGAATVMGFDGRYVPEELPACGDQKFTVSPVELEAITTIEPLGALNPPGHTIPTDHVYFSSQSSGGQGPAIRAPGDVFLLEVSGPEDLSRPGDFKIGFALCDQVFGFYLHVATVSTEVQSAFGDVPCEQDWVAGHPELCTRFSNHPVRAGTVLGSANPSGPFDLGTYDYRAPLAYANPYRYGDPDYGRPRGLYVTCPFDYYTPRLQRALYEKVERTAEPRCGEVMLDVPGTLQGNWFYEDTSPALPSGWDGQLAFVYDHRDPSLAAISVGGLFMEAGVWRFSPERQGTVNRQFDGVTPRRTIYCYQADGARGRIILRLVNEDELSIEHQRGTCDGRYTFENSTTYHR